MEETDQKKLDEKVVSSEELKQYKETLPNDQRVVEVNENEYKTIHRLRG